VKDSDDNSGNPVATNQPTDMGKAFTSQEISRTFSIENTGTTNAEVVSVKIDNPNFSIVEQPTIITPNSFERLTVVLKSDKPGVYTGRITIQYKTGSFEFSVVGEMKDRSIFVYNAVTPNGDGAHDFLKIVNIELYSGNTVTILNRLGETIFKTDNYNNTEPTKRFEGQSNLGSGQNLTDGTYYYVIDLGNSDRQTGFLLLQK
jgi:gliding motility-associated-like protein